jgi:putative transposase
MTSRRKSTSVSVPQQLPVLAPDDALRSMLSTLLQSMIEEEFATFLGAAPHERTATRTGWRNGHRDRQFTTRVGTLTLRIPRDRAGEFAPSLFARYQRSEQAFMLALAEMYVQGVSTRKVTHIVETLCGVTISASEVSALVKRLDQELAAWRTRSLADTRYPYLVLDAHHEQVRREGHVRATAMLWVIGITAEGFREHLGVWLGNSESLESWSAVCKDLRRRGLTHVDFTVADEHAGLVEALRRYFPEAAHQRCQVHYLRNALSTVASPKLQQQLTAALRDVWSAPTRADADARLAQLITALEKSLPQVAAWLEDTAASTLTVFELPTPELRRKLRTTNGSEHDHAEMRRRTRVIRIFPNEASLIRLSTALAIERNEQWLSRRYFMPATQEVKIYQGKVRIRRTA